MLAEPTTRKGPFYMVNFARFMADFRRQVVVQYFSMRMEATLCSIAELFIQACDIDIKATHPAFVRSNTIWTRLPANLRSEVLTEVRFGAFIDNIVNDQTGLLRKIGMGNFEESY